jgi:hypothetical protein
MLAWAEHSGLPAGVRSGVNGIAGPVASTSRSTLCLQRPKQRSNISLVSTLTVSGEFSCLAFPRPSSYEPRRNSATYPRSRQLDKAETDRTTRENEVRPLEPKAFVRWYYSFFINRIINVFLLAESIKTFTTLQQQLSVSQATSRENLPEAADTQAKLAPSEGSWR